MERSKITNRKPFFRFATLILAGALALPSCATYRDPDNGKHTFAPVETIAMWIRFAGEEITKKRFQSAEVYLSRAEVADNSSAAADSGFGSGFGGSSLEARTPSLPTWMIISKKKKELALAKDDYLQELYSQASALEGQNKRSEAKEIWKKIVELDDASGTYAKRAAKKLEE
jgi:hypothetical protein